MTVNQIQHTASCRDFEPKGVYLSIILFIEEQLPDFRIDKCQIDKKSIEKSYNSQLSMYLQTQNNSSVFLFHNAPHQSNSREPDIGTVIRTRVLNGNYDSIFDIECKRLNSTLSHVREYVSGNTGGIERFKRNEHGVDMSFSAMIGYVEDKTGTYWLNQINAWINELHIKYPAFWKETEHLSQHANHFKSTHEKPSSQYITLFHFFYSVQYL
ncbi:MAG: hypothetical protein LBF59_01475 [Prevotellaceae bacterium]|jgi:hypothetical protein|nr:hypothetical protein [Prevotellaceae bacterium]